MRVMNLKSAPKGWSFEPVRQQPRSPDVTGHVVLRDCLIARRQDVRERPRRGNEMQHSALPDRHLRGLSQALATPAAPKVAPVTGSANVP